MEWICEIRFWIFTKTACSQEQIKPEIKEKNKFRKKKMTQDFSARYEPCTAALYQVSFGAASMSLTSFFFFFYFRYTMWLG